MKRKLIFSVFVGSAVLCVLAIGIKAAYPALGAPKNKSCLVDLPEEIQATTTDSTHPDKFTGYMKDGKLILGFDHSVKIIKQVTDERGLTSVIIVTGNDTTALDYLTKHEIDSLTK